MSKRNKRPRGTPKGAFAGFKGRTRAERYSPHVTVSMRCTFCDLRSQPLRQTVANAKERGFPLRCLLCNGLLAPVQ